MPTSAGNIPWFRNRVKARNNILSDSWNALGRVQVLGDEDADIGHYGCINALSWSSDGNTLVSSGDDTRICLWGLHGTEYKCDNNIGTGHTGNVFSAHFLASSSRIATCAADRQVRVFDVSRSSRNSEDSPIQVFRCHRNRVKRIIPQGSPDCFLSVSEDQTVREQDLRVPHSCPNCPAPLLRLPYALSTLAISPLSPWLFTVAGESQYAHLFDRRMIQRMIQNEWGAFPSEDNSLTCVRRYGRDPPAHGESRGEEHITGSRMSQSNGHELLLSYSADAVYLYSLYDEPNERSVTSDSPSLLPPNQKRPRILSRSSRGASTEAGERDVDLAFSSSLHEPEENGDDGTEVDVEMEDHVDDAPESDDDEEDSSDDEHVTDPPWLARPVVRPIRRFVGACNVETVKDVNFLGPNDEFVASGSDDGNWFMWSKATGEVHGIWEGDGSVVNCIEAHPTLPIVAVSGIDSSVKLFAPDTPYAIAEPDNPNPVRSMSRIRDKESIFAANSDPRARLLNARRLQMGDLLIQFGVSRESVLTSGQECVIM